MANKKRLKVSDLLVPGSQAARLRREKLAEGTARKGWYRDKQGEAEYRFWDGTAWTEHTSPDPRDDDPTE